MRLNDGYFVDHDSVKEPADMSKILQWFIGLIAVLVIGIGSLLFMLRSHDGPMEIISGGPFKTGELVTGVTDWSFLQDRITIELQTMLPPRSRVIWLAVHQNRLYVLSSYMNTVVGRVWKRWPRAVEKDNRAIIRADGKLYALQLTRIQEGEQIASVLESFNQKYDIRLTPEAIRTGSTWLFELTPR